jgi:hypothetical protein
MKHFGILCPPGTEHLNPMSALGFELRQRGHRVLLLCLAYLMLSLTLLLLRLSFILLVTC